MTTFPRSPRLLNGAIIGLDPANPLASVIAFQQKLMGQTRLINYQALTKYGML
ncbi:hypothetical protein SAMN05216316_0933 [Nitrosovibrio sp. Nv6]|nr:hypothetical protein SAMN05216316_0933 [Nitrosovibrio sp. Nv6]